MSQIHYSWRRYRPGDEDAINALYRQVTGRLRSREQWAWQWQQAPAGKGDIFLIEATQPDGRVDLVGHHGIMPVRFTRGDGSLLFGKTENTMVLPEYRTRILYPRFESRFAKEYEARYHALFSTMGPVAAIRQRKALGYVADHRWVYLEQASEPWGSLIRLGQRPRFRAIQRAMSLMLDSDTHAPLPDGVELLTAEEALREPFLKNYWERARTYWGVAPSRAPEDLAWRYWNNPYSDHYAVIVRQSGGDALVVVEHHAPGAVSIEDFSALKPDVVLLLNALKLAVVAVKKRLAVRLITCNMTDDALSQEAMAAMRPWHAPSLFSRLRKTDSLVGQNFMPRKVTASGLAVGLEQSRWNVTFAVSEGRR